MNIKFFLITFILAFFIGIISFYIVINNTVLNSAPTPWIIITLLLFSSTYCVQALFKLPEANEHPSLTSDELRRLKPIIKLKKKRLTIILCYHVISAISVAVGFFSIPTSSKFFVPFFMIIGGLVLSSLYSFFFIKSNIDEAQEFKSTLIHRAENEKRKKDLLENMNKEPK